MADTENLNNEAEPQSKLLAVIPEVHYDLAARIMPGALILLFAYFLFNTGEVQRISDWLFSPASAALSFGSVTILLVIGTALSWCSGMLLTPIGDGIHICLFRGSAFREFCRLNEANLELAAKIGFVDSPIDGGGWTGNRKWSRWNEQSGKTYQELHDGLKETGKTAKAILPKAQAELVFYQSLTAGLLVLLFLGAATFFAAAFFEQSIEAPPEPDFLIKYMFVAFLFLLSLWGQRFKAKRLWSRHASFLVSFLLANKGQ